LQYGRRENGLRR